MIINMRKLEKKGKPGGNMWGYTLKQRAGRRKLLGPGMGQEVLGDLRAQALCSQIWELDMDFRMSFLQG